MHKLAAVVAAAGLGRRMQNSTAKQYLELGGLPILVRSLQLFAGFAATSEIAVVIPAGDFAYVQGLLKPYFAPVSFNLVAGGKTRQESVFKGLKALKTKAPFVAIHDAARPLAGSPLLARLLPAAALHGAAVPALCPADTIKEADEEGFIVKTCRRERLRLVQTPQVFARHLIERAHREAAEKAFSATDDAALVELLGHPVAVVAGNKKNIKITTAHELKLAEYFLQEEGF